MIEKARWRRLLKMGATLYPRTYKPDEDFRILVDREGNHLCVVQLPKEKRRESNIASILTVPPSN